MVMVVTVMMLGALADFFRHVFGNVLENCLGNFDAHLFRNRAAHLLGQFARHLYRVLGTYL